MVKRKHHAHKEPDKDSKKQKFDLQGFGFAGIPGALVGVATGQKGRKDPLPEHISTYARFADAVYKDDGIQRRGYVVSNIGKDWQYRAKLSNDHIGVWENLNSNEIITSFRGTSDWNDVRTDVALALGQEAMTSRFKESLDQFDKVLETYQPGQYSHTLVGHSLGGSINEYVFSKRNASIDRVHNFNPGASVSSVGTHIDTAVDATFRKERKDKVTNHHIIGDPISMLKTIDPTAVTYEMKAGNLNAHTIKQFF